MSTKRKYIDSHWLVFALHGVIGLVFGLYIIGASLQVTTMNSMITSEMLVNIVAIALLTLGVVELLNMFYRARKQETWGLSVVVAFLEIAAAFGLLFTQGQDIVWHLAIIASYTVLRGVFEILIGLRAVDDMTDKFIWIVCGICGVVLGFVILNSGHFSNATTFLQFFGAYMMVFGLGNLIYGVHNLNQKKEYSEEQRQNRLAKQNRKATARVKKAATKAKTVKKTTRKTTRRTTKKRE